MGKSVVLNFHKETDAAMFEKMIIALKSKYRLVDLRFLTESFKTKKEFNSVCHITFDDGDLSFYTTIFPLLKKHEVPVTLFVSPKIVAEGSNFWFQEIEGADPQLIKGLLSKKTNVPTEKLSGIQNEMIFKCLPMKDIKEVVAVYKKEINPEKKQPQNINIQQLLELENSGLVTIGAHTLNHPILQNEDNASCLEEVSGSIKQLAALLNHPVYCFAYPNGRPGLDFGEREKSFLRENGITICFSTELDHLSIKSDPLSLPRMGFARMGLAPSNPLIYLRMFLGKNWPDIRAIGKPGEKEMRNKIYSMIREAEAT